MFTSSMHFHSKCFSSLQKTPGTKNSGIIYPICKIATALPIFKKLSAHYNCPLMNWPKINYTSNQQMRAMTNTAMFTFSFQDKC